jgi:hypothetical protein
MLYYVILEIEQNKFSNTDSSQRDRSQIRDITYLSLLIVWYPMKKGTTQLHTSTA